MKLRIFLSLLISTPSILLAQALPTPIPTPTPDAKHAPKITCGKTKFDFGNVDEGPEITHEFDCRNSGHGKLIVTNVQTSCGCTTAVLKKRGAKDTANYPVTFLPGEIIPVRATYHTQGRPGPAHKVITVVSNDPANPNFAMELNMTVVREIDIQPSERIALFDVHKDVPQAPTTIKILGKANHPLHILSATPKNGIATVTSLSPYEDPNDHRSGAALVVDLSKGMTIGPFNDEILVKTDNKKKPEITIPVMGEVKGHIQYPTSTIYFSPHQDFPVTINFTADKTVSFVIRDVKSVNHLTRPHIQKTTGNDGKDLYSIVATCIKDLPKDSDGKDQILVTTNDTEMPLITLNAQVNK